LNYGLDHTTAETAVTFVRNSVLTRRNGALRVVEQNPCRAIAARLEKRRLVYLPVTYLDGASKRCDPWLAQPVHWPGRERRAAQQRVIVPLHYD
jgi:hypothetical protein